MFSITNSTYLFRPNITKHVADRRVQNEWVCLVLLQRHVEVRKLVQCGSRFLTDDELQYAVIEIEFAAVHWAVKKCGIYLTGLSHFDLIVDHRPLVLKLNRKQLSEIENLCLQRIREKN